MHANTCLGRTFVLPYCFLLWDPKTNLFSSRWEILTGVLIPVLLYFMSAFLTFLLPFCWISGLLLTLTHTSNIRKTMTIGGKLLLFLLLIVSFRGYHSHGWVHWHTTNRHEFWPLICPTLFVCCPGEVLLFCYFGPVVGWLLTRICFLVSYCLLSYIFTPFPFFRISSMWFFFRFFWKGR